MSSRARPVRWRRRAGWAHFHGPDSSVRHARALGARTHHLWRLEHHEGARAGGVLGVVPSCERRVGVGGG